MYVAQERRAYILRLLEQRGQLRSAELAQELMVTDETIRTDLVQLQKAGLLRRVHGGAVYVFPQGGEADSLRLDCQLAARAARHVEPGMRVYLDPSPASRALVAQWGAGGYTLLTPSPAEAAVLAAGALGQKVELPGGLVQRPSGLLVCEQDARWWQQRPVQAAVLYPDAVEPDAVGYTDPLRAAWAEQAARHALRTVVVAPARLLRAEAPCHFRFPYHVLVTEDHVPPNFGKATVETVPFLDAAAALPQQGFDY